ncbi:MAG TPA: carboxypeptidase regulatory-like domain-containing protein [Terriglobia bacterium]
MVISSASDITARTKDVVVRVAATQAGQYGVALSQHEKEIAYKSIALGANATSTVTFTVPRSLGGVIIATVFDDQKTPLAERLVFRAPEHRLKVQVTTDRADYVPGDKVSLRVSTTDEAGKPVAAVVGLTATDSSILEVIDKREQAPRLPVMVLLEHEVKDLADAHVYLDETNPKAPLATDLLLGTQGWRRFAFVGNGAFSGDVRDSTHALISGATIEATNVVTGSFAWVITSQSGKYTFPVLPSGTYRVSAFQRGFQTQIVELQVGHNGPARQDFRLQATPVARVAEMAAAGPIGAGGRGGGRAVLPQAQAGAPPEQQGQQGQAAGILSGVLGGVIRRANADVNVPAAELPVDKDMARVLRDKKQPAGRLIPNNLVAVREYAHALAPDWTEASRSDFSETVYWNAGVKTDERTGIATVSFNLSDSVTSFRVLADAFSQDGTLGSGASEIESVQPFSIEPKIPLQVTSGDVIQLPVSMVNGVSRELRDAQLTAKGPDGIHFTMPGSKSTTLGPKERSRQLVQVEVGREFSGLANLMFDANAGSYSDSVKRTLDVQSPGFPHETSMGGTLERTGSRTFEFTIPEDVVHGSLSSSVTVYPTPFASMTDALQSLLQQPYGCFEQTSSTSYPMVMAQQYFLTHTGVDPAIIEKARDLLEVSYKRLTGFESRTRGYEWFGGDPGHEALTAYGLMQFTDMSQVRSVDKDMLDRTRGWLLSRRDSKGGFNLSSKAVDTFGHAPVDTTNAYIVWALIEAGEKPAGLAKEIAAIKASADSTQDSYILALSANILHETGDPAGARELMDRLVKKQASAGNVDGAVTSITRSGGDALAIETTALSVLAWMHEPAYAENVERSMRWIIQSNKSGRFGSTQSTVLALRSIVAYDNAHARPKTPGRIVLAVDGKPVGQPVAFTADTKGALKLPEFANVLGAGKHAVAVRMEDGSDMPFSIGIQYHSLLPDSSDQTKIAIRVSLKDSSLQEGAVTEAAVSIANKTGEAIPSPVAIVGIPGGLEVRHDQLKELVRAGRIDAYEVIGREVVLYWRYLKANDNFELPLSLVAAIPGSFTGPASRAYLYYTDEYKNWAPGLRVTVTAR